MPSKISSYDITLLDKKAMQKFVRVLAQKIFPGILIYLSGDLGTGKTYFTQELLRELGYKKRVKSPTFSLLEIYTLEKFSVYHFDFYRMSNSLDWLNLGFDEFFGRKEIVVVEWPECAGGSSLLYQSYQIAPNWGMLPIPDICLFFSFGQSKKKETLNNQGIINDESRTLCVSAYTSQGSLLLESVECI